MRMIKSLFYIKGDESMEHISCTNEDIYECYNVTKLL
jgi:hypothetical protein